jgi:hypothetical protein
MARKSRKQIQVRRDLSRVITAKRLMNGKKENHPNVPKYKRGSLPISHRKAPALLLFILTNQLIKLVIYYCLYTEKRFVW